MNVNELNALYTVDDKAWIEEKIKIWNRDNDENFTFSDFEQVYNAHEFTYVDIEEAKAEEIDAQGEDSEQYEQLLDIENSGHSVAFYFDQETYLPPDAPEMAVYKIDDRFPSLHWEAFCRFCTMYTMQRGL